MSLSEAFESPVFCITVTPYGAQLLTTYFPNGILALATIVRQILTDHLNLDAKLDLVTSACCSLTPVCSAGGLVFHLSLGGEILDLADPLALEEFAVFLQCEIRDRFEYSLASSEIVLPSASFANFYVTRVPNLFTFL